MAKMDFDSLFQTNKHVANVANVEEKKQDNQVAIIGVSLNFPYAKNLDEIWNVMMGKVESYGELSKQRKKDCEDVMGLLGESKDQYNLLTGCFLKDISQFDESYFGYTPRESEYMSPTQRELLQGAVLAVYDAGYALSAIKGSKTGVYVGYIGDGDGGQYLNMLKEILPSNRKSMAVAGNLASVIAGRIAYELDLHGPVSVIDTACSSSLVALHTAVQAIQRGECEQALVGSAKLISFPIENDYVIGMESKDGRTRAFDDAASGTGTGEGMICLFLKPLEKAKQDHDDIYAVIMGSSVNHDGRTMGVTAPNADAQEKVLLDAWNNAKIDPKDICYIETHGTGTRLGDPIEVTGLEHAFQNYTTKKQFCAIGAMKTNFGHLYEASGLAGVVKLIASMQHGIVPPNANFEKPNGIINFIESPVYVMDEPLELPKENCIVGVSSFGFSGTNCHVVLTNSPKEEIRDEQLEQYKFLFSAHTETALRKELIDFGEWLESKESEKYSCADISSTLCNGRDWYQYGIVLLASNKEEIFIRVKKIIRQIDAQNCEELLVGQAKPVVEQKGNIAHIHLPVYPIEKKRHWFTDAYQQKTKRMLHTLDWVKYCEETEVVENTDATWICVSDKQDYEKIKTACQGELIWQEFEKDAVKKLVSKITNKEQSGIVICQPVTPCDSIEIQMEQSAELAEELIGLLKSLEQSGLRKKLSIRIVSKGLFGKVTDGADYTMLYPVAMYKNIVNEFADVDIKVVDTDASKESMDWVVKHLSHLPHFLLAVHLGVPYMQRLQTKEAASETYEVSKNNSSYLVFGGSGGIGHTIIEYLAKNGAQNIISVQRKKVCFEGETNSNVVEYACDLTKRSDVTALFEQLEKKQIEIKGIFHCAGAAGGTMLHSLEEVNSKSIIEPKTFGVSYIAEAIKKYQCLKNLEFLILNSSAMIHMGIQGQAQYSVGNTFMNLYAYELRKEGIPACAVDWAAWSDVGMAKDNEFYKQDMLLENLTSKEAMEIFPALLTTDNANLVVGRIHYDRIDETTEQMFPFQLGDRQEKMAPKHAKAEERETEQEIYYEQNEIEERILHIVKEITGRGKVQKNDNLLELGGDSIMFSEIHNEIDTMFPKKVTISQMFVHPNIQEIAKIIFDKQEKREINSKEKEIVMESVGIGKQENEEISLEDAIALLES